VGRRFLRAVLRLVLSVFYRRIELRGLEKIPTKGPVIFVLNHPNGLVDPLFILCFAPRRVAFLAKSTLFRTPVIGWMVRTLEAIPVYRSQDREDPAKNRETFGLCTERLAAGRTIALFPEGTTHSDPALKPLKSGAARIALQAAAAIGAGGPRLKVVPVGLYYTAKATFRSEALALFGDPFEVEPATAPPVAPQDEGGEPAAEPVRALNARIDAALREVTLNCDRVEALDLIVRAEQVFTFGEATGSLARELELKRRFVDGFTAVRERDPARVEALAERILSHERKLAASDIDPLSLRRRARPAGATGFVAMRALLLSLLLPLTALGALLHVLPYRAVGWLTRRFAREDDSIAATIKVLAGLLLFPLTWGLLATAAGLAGGGAIGAVATLVGVPALGYGTVRHHERWGDLHASLRAFVWASSRPRFIEELIVERQAIADEIHALARELQSGRLPSAT